MSRRNFVAVLGATDPTCLAATFIEWFGSGMSAVRDPSSTPLALLRSPPPRLAARLD
jgi:hypothetical protein